MVCLNCGSDKFHPHDNCDDEHSEDEKCCVFYCDECGEGFDGE